MLFLHHSIFIHFVRFDRLVLREAPTRLGSKCRVQRDFDLCALALC
jgi:hypothetical protein